MSGGIEEAPDPRTVSERAKKLSLETSPGQGNEYFEDSLRDMSRVVTAFIEDTNNWFEILDTRLYRKENIGIPCRYRWTIKRWAANDMDQWLMDHGWEDMAHLKADSVDHEDNELEARYRKEIGGYTVWANFYVEITNDVFEALQTGGPVKMAEKNREREERMERLRQEKRSG